MFESVSSKSNVLVSLEMEMRLWVVEPALPPAAASLFCRMGCGFTSGG